MNWNPKKPLNPKYIPVRFLIPNIITLMGLCAGVSAIRMAIEGRFELAVFAILTAAVLDGIDGPTARKLQAQTEFGGELDSLADFVSFGISPAIILFTYSMNEIKSLGWIFSLLFAVATALRLARFNVTPKIEGDDEWKNNYFVGVPSPAGAVVVLLPLYFDFLEMYPVKMHVSIVLIHTVLMALLLVSQVPTFSLKTLGRRIEFHLVLPIFLIGALYVALFFTYTYMTLIVTCVTYLLTIPISFLRYHRRAKVLEAGNH